MEKPERPEETKRDLDELKEQITDIGAKILEAFHKLSVLLEKIK